MGVSVPRLHAAQGSRHTGLRELGVFTAAVVTYFGVRALTEGDEARAMHNADVLMEFERRVGLDREQSVQALVSGSAVRTDAVNAVYVYGHWPVILGSGTLLFRHSRSNYRTLRNAFLISGGIGLVISRRETCHPGFSSVYRSKGVRTAHPVAAETAA